MGGCEVARGGADLSDEQREEMTNREGVASGRATTTTCILQKQFIDKSNFVVRT